MVVRAVFRHRLACGCHSSKGRVPMLLSFRFANHRSFRDEQQLNLLPVYETDDAPDSEASLEAVPVVGIFGANASGKSNAVKALIYLHNMVGSSDRESEPGRGIRRQPFRLAPEVSAQPSSYAVDLQVEGVRHTYGATLNDREILEEWLYSYPRGKKRIIFERNRQDFRWGEESGRSAIRKLAEIVAPTALFLSVSARFEPHGTARGRDDTSASMHSTFTWLWQKMSTVGTTVPRLRQQAADIAEWLTENEDRRSMIIDLVRAADIGLQNIVTPSPTDGSLFEYPGRVQFLHQGTSDDALLDISDESSGTLRFLALTGRATEVLDTGGLLLVDEIDASLHPLLTASLVRLFQSPTVNKKGAQLVFTTHDATLLGSIDGEDVLRRDQVWFTSKGDDGASDLFPLAEFKPRRQGENRLKRYLNGSYGAIPELSMRLFEQAVTSRVGADAD